MTLRTCLREFLAACRLATLKQNRHRILAMLTVYPLLAALFGSWLQAGALTLGCMFLVDFTIRRYLNALAGRTEAKNSPTWDVEINQVKVGSITDAEYAAIRYAVFADARPYYAQAFNVIRIAINAFNYCYISIPLGIFWIAIGLAVLAPDTFSSTVTAIQNATPTEIGQAASTAGSLLMLTMMLVVVFHWACGLSRFGFVNRFDEAVTNAIRQRCSVAAEGTLQLSRWTDEGPVFPDEGSFMRTRGRHR